MIYRAFVTEKVPTLCYNRIFKLFLAYWTLLWYFTIIAVGFTIRRNYISLHSLLSFLLNSFPVLFHFPSRLIIASIMKVQTGISIATVAIIMPVFAKSQIIIKSTRWSDILRCSDGTQGASNIRLINFFLCFVGVFSIIILTSVYLCIHLPCFDLLREIKPF